MKITLTEKQAKATLEALEWAINENNTQHDADNACRIRIIDKIKDELGLPHDDYGYLGHLDNY